MNARPAPPEDSGKIAPFPGSHTPRSAPIDHAGQPATPPATLDRFHFQYRGRRWRIAKRPGSPFWQLIFESRGKRYRPSLGSASKQQAMAEAKLRIDLFLEGRETELRAAMQRPAHRFSTFADIFARVDELDIEADTRTRRDYVWAVRWVLKRALCVKTDAEVDRLTAQVLTRETGRAFFASVRAESARMDNPAAANKFRRSSSQIFSFCKALFSPLALESMRELGLQLPDPTAFRQSSKASRLASSEDTEFHCPEDAILRRTLGQWAQMGRGPLAGIPEEHRRNCFIAAGLMLSCALRKSEVRQVSWRWFQVQGGRPLLTDAAVNQKDGKEYLRVRPLDPFWRVLNRIVDLNQWRGAPDELCLSARPKLAGKYRSLKFSHGGRCDNYYWPFYWIGKWLRGLGWQTQKTNHALRDYVGSLVTMKHGLERAMIFLRHKHLSTTQSHYNRFVREDDMDDAKRLAWFDWAK